MKKRLGPVEGYCCVRMAPANEVKGTPAHEFIDSESFMPTELSCREFTEEFNSNNEITNALTPVTRFCKVVIQEVE